MLTAKRQAELTEEREERAEAERRAVAAYEKARRKELQAKLENLHRETRKVQERLHGRETLAQRVAWLESELKNAKKELAAQPSEAQVLLSKARNRVASRQAEIDQHEALVQKLERNKAAMVLRPNDFAHATIELERVTLTRPILDARLTEAKDQLATAEAGVKKSK